MINYIYNKLDDASPCVLLLHGWGVNLSYMEMIAKSLQSQYSTLLIDLPGHGKSFLNKELNCNDYCNEIFKIVFKLKIKNLYGIGHSFGGKLLLKYALSYRINGLILIAPSSYKPKINISIFIKIRLYKVLKRFGIHIPKGLMGSFDYQNSTGLKRKTFLNVVNDYLSKEELKQIKINTKVIGFDKDKAVSLYQLKKTTKYLPNSELIILKGNHFSYINYLKEIGILSQELTNIS